jgi:hypothetical protein
MCINRGILQIENHIQELAHTLIKMWDQYFPTDPLILTQVHHHREETDLPLSMMDIWFEIRDQESLDITDLYTKI